MKKTTILTGLTLIAALGSTALMAEARGRDGGPRMDLTQMDADGDGAITQAEVAAFQTARFNEADTNGDGALSKEELLAAAAERFDGDVPERAEKRLDRMFSHLDADDSGTITLDEQNNDERTARLFDHLDADEDGTISADELKEAKGRHGDRGKGGRHGGDKKPSNG